MGKRNRRRGVALMAVAVLAFAVLAATGWLGLGVIVGVIAFALGALQWHAGLGRD